MPWTPTGGMEWEKAFILKFPSEAEQRCSRVSGGTSGKRKNFYLLPLGPMTNLASLFLKRPDLIEQIDELVSMGGAEKPWKLFAGCRI